MCGCPDTNSKRDLGYYTSGEGFEVWPCGDFRERVEWTMDRSLMRCIYRLEGDGGEGVYRGVGG